MRPVTLGVIVLLATILSSCSLIRQEPLRAERGVLDLSAQALIEPSPPRPIQGTWEVYVGERHEPHELQEPHGPDPMDGRRFLEVPPRGSRFYTLAGERLVSGVITYRMRMLGLPPGRPLALRVPLVYGTLRAWVNGVPVLAVGCPEDRRTQVEAGVIIPVVADESGTADLRICIESVYYPYSGMTVAPPVLGSFDQVLRVRSAKVFRDGLLVGLVLLVAFYHLLLVFSPNRDLPHGILTLCALAVAWRLAAAEGEMVLGSIPFLSATAYMRLQGFAVYTLIPLYTAFLERFVPLDSSRGTFRLVRGASWVWLLASLLVPLSWWMDLLFAYYVVLVPGLYAIAVTIRRAARARRGGMVTIMAGFALIVMAGVFEILQVLSLFVTDFAPIGGALVVFLLLNSFAVSRRMVDFRISLSNLREQAQRDGLTGLFNRRTFDARLQEEWVRHVRSGQSLAVIMVDVDHFKRYNDTCGHQAGDQVLRAVARVMNDMAQRAADIVARYGGEEFVLVLPTTEASGAYRLANRILQGVRRTAIPHPASPEKIITVSLGVAAVVPDHETHLSESAGPGSLVIAADRALYDAKQSGRNTVRTAAVEVRRPGS